MTTTTLESALVAKPVQPSERRHYWVMPKLQARLVGWLVAISALAATTAAWVVLLAVWSPLGDQLVWAGPGVDPDRLFWDACLRVIWTTVLLVVIFGLVAFVVGVIVSHRVAGPLHRIGVVASQVSQGQYQERVELRRGDYIKEAARQINEMLEHVDGQIRRQRHTLNAVYARLSDIEMALADGRPSVEADMRLQDALRLLREARLSELSEDMPYT